MKIKVSELTGAKLDFWVVKAHELDQIHLGDVFLRGNRAFVSAVEVGAADASFEPSSNWDHGGPVIDHYGIWLQYLGEKRCKAALFDVVSCGDPREYLWPVAETALIAAMRALVASRFGEEVDEP